MLKIANEKMDNAVSPVIGVILMVAITVILAAVISVFVLDLGEGLQGSNSQVNLGFEYNSTTDQVTITHRGGSTLEADQISVVVNGQNANYTGGQEFPNEISAGNSAIITGYGSQTGFNNTDTVQVIESSSEGEQTQILDEFVVRK